MTGRGAPPRCTGVVVLYDRPLLLLWRFASVGNGVVTQKEETYLKDRASTRIPTPSFAVSFVSLRHRGTSCAGFCNDCGRIRCERDVTMKGGRRKKEGALVVVVVGNKEKAIKSKQARLLGGLGGHQIHTPIGPGYPGSSVVLIRIYSNFQKTFSSNKDKNKW